MHKDISNRPLSRWLSIFLFVMLVGLLVFNTVSYLTIRQYNEAVRERKRGYRILALLESSLGGLLAMQSAVRGFVITENPSYMDGFARIEAGVTQDIEEAGSLIVLPVSRQRHEALKKLAG